MSPDLSRSSQRIVFDCPQCHAKVSPKRALSEANGPLCPYCRGALNIPKEPNQVMPWSAHVQQAYFYLLDMKPLVLLGIITGLWYAGFALVPDQALIFVRLAGWFALLLLGTRLFRYTAHGLPDTDIWKRPGIRDGFSLLVNPLIFFPVLVEVGNYTLWQESVIGQTLWSSFLFLVFLAVMPFVWLAYATGGGWLSAFSMQGQKQRFRAIEMEDWLGLWFFSLFGLGVPLLLLFLTSLFFPYGLGALLKLPVLFLIAAGTFWTARLIGRFAYFNNQSLEIERISRVRVTQATYKPTDLLTDAQKAMEKDQPERAEQLYREKLSQSPINLQAAKGLYQAVVAQNKAEEIPGVARLVIQVSVENGAVKQAADFFNSLLEKQAVPPLEVQDFSALRQQAQQSQDKLLEARLLRVQAQQHPNHPETPQALLDCAVLLFRDLGKPDVAAQICQHLVQHYPQTPQSGHAQTFLQRVGQPS